jgi:hypothetical protein
MRIVMLTKQIDSTNRLVELKLKMSEMMSSSGLEAQVFMSINILMNKLEKLNVDLDGMMTEKRTTNPIIGNVFNHAARALGLDPAETSMGLPKHNEDYGEDSSFVGGLQ